MSADQDCSRPAHRIDLRILSNYVHNLITLVLSIGEQKFLEVVVARPAKFDRSEALVSAMHAIWEDGFEHSSVKALSERLGITRSSFYNAFGSREDLFRESLAYYFGQSPDAPLREGFDGPVLPVITSVFRNICKVRAADPRRRGCLVVNTVCELSGDETGELSTEVSDIVIGSARHMESILILAREGGEIPEESNVHALALSLQNLMIGLNVLCKALPDEQELWLLTRTTLAGLGLLHEVSDA